MQHPLLPLVVLLVAGITIGYHAAIPACIVILLSLSSLAGLFFSVMRSKRLCAVSFLMLSVVALGIFNVGLHLSPAPQEQDITPFLDRDKVTIEGIICETPQIWPHKIDLLVAAKKVKDNTTSIAVNVKVLISLRLRDRTFHYGDYIRARVRLRTPHNFNNPGGFDYRKFLRFRGIPFRGSVNNPIDIVTIRGGKGNSLKASLERYRAAIRNLILNNAPFPENKVLQALILGEKHEIPLHITDTFNRTGISHILAISGLHIGIIAFLSVFLIKGIMKTSTYLLLRFNVITISLVLSTVPIIGYALISGLRISTIRATIMVIAFLTAILIGRERNLLNTLSLAALVILAFSPTSLFDVSFQLSFVAVASIIVVTPALQSLVPKYRSLDTPCVQKLIIFICVTLSATLGTAPLIAHYFNRISTLTVLSNLLIIPIIGFAVLPLGLIASVILPLSTAAASLLIASAAPFISVSLTLLEWLERCPWSSFSVATPPVSEIILYYCLIILAVKLIHTRRLHYAAAIALATLCIIGLFTCRHTGVINPGNLKVTVLDVGQGSSALVRFPHGRTMLVDGGGFYGGTFDVGRHVVAPYLWHEGLKKIDIVVLTHPHQDHLAGLLFVLKNFTVGEVWSNGERTCSDSYKEFTRIITDRAIPHRIVHRGTPERIVDGVIIGILHPPSPGSGPVLDTNNASVVMKIEYKDVNLLFPGDIEEPGEAWLIKDGNLESAILLAPHHGAYTSITPSFLTAVRPRYVLCSCGRNNYFGYPHQKLVNICRDHGITLLRTDEQGAIRFTADGTDIRYTCTVP